MLCFLSVLCRVWAPVFPFTAQTSMTKRGNCAIYLLCSLWMSNQASQGCWSQPFLHETWRQSLFAGHLWLLSAGEGLAGCQWAWGSLWYTPWRLVFRAHRCLRESQWRTSQGYRKLPQLRVSDSGGKRGMTTIITAKDLSQKWGGLAAKGQIWGSGASFSVGAEVACSTGRGLFGCKCWGRMWS